MKRFARFLPSLRTRLALVIALVAAGCAHRPAAEEPPDPVAELCRVLSEREGYPIPVGLVLMRAKAEDTSPDEYARAWLRELGVEGWAEKGSEDDPPNPFEGEPNPNLVVPPAPDSPAARAFEAWWAARGEAAETLLLADADRRPVFDVVPLADPAAPSRAELVALDALPDDAEWLLRLRGADLPAHKWFPPDALAPTGALLRLRGLEAGAAAPRAGATPLPPECAIRCDLTNEVVRVLLSNPNPFPILVETEGSSESRPFIRAHVTAETRHWWQTNAVGSIMKFPAGLDDGAPRPYVRERVLRPGDDAAPFEFAIPLAVNGRWGERMSVRMKVRFREAAVPFPSDAFEAEVSAADGELSMPSVFAAPGIAVRVHPPQPGATVAWARLVNVTDDDLLVFCGADFRPAPVRTTPDGPGTPLADGFLRLLDPMSEDGGICCCEHPFVDWDVPLPEDGAAPPVPTVSVIRLDELRACRTVDEIVDRLAAGTVTPSDPAPPPRDPERVRRHRHSYPAPGPDAADPPPLLLEASVEGTNLVASARVGGDRPVLALVYHSRRRGEAGMNTMVYEKIGPDDEYSGIEYGGWGGSYQIGELHLEHFDPEYYRLLFPDPDAEPLRWPVPQPNYLREIKEERCDCDDIGRNYLEFSVRSYILWPETKESAMGKALLRKSGCAIPPNPAWPEVSLPLAADATLPDRAGRSAGYFRAIELNDAFLAPDAERFELRLGPIHGIAEAYVNGQTVDVRNDSDATFAGDVPRYVLGPGTNTVEVVVRAADGAGGFRAADPGELVLRAVPSGDGPAREVSLAGPWLVRVLSPPLSDANAFEAAMDSVREPNPDPVFFAEGGEDGAPVRCAVSAPEGQAFVVAVDARGVPATVVEPLADSTAPSCATIDRPLGLEDPPYDAFLFRRLPAPGEEPLRFDLDAARFSPTGRLVRLCGRSADPAAKEDNYHKQPECRIARDRASGELVVTVADTNGVTLVETLADGTGARTIRTTVRAESRTADGAGWETILPETAFGPEDGAPGWFPVLQRITKLRPKYRVPPPTEFEFRVPVGREAIEADRIVLRTTVRWGQFGVAFAVPFRSTEYEIVDGITLPPAPDAESPGTSEPSSAVLALSSAMSEKMGYAVPPDLILSAAKSAELDPDEFARMKLEELGIPLPAETLAEKAESGK